MKEKTRVEFVVMLFASVWMKSRSKKKRKFEKLLIVGDRGMLVTVFGISLGLKGISHARAHLLMSCIQLSNYVFCPYTPKHTA